METILLDQVVASLGYGGIEDFLNDNPGAVDMVFDFIRENFPDFDLEEFV